MPITETEHHAPDNQRQVSRGRRRSDHAPAVGDPRTGRPHRHQVRLRCGAVRRLYRARERSAGTLLPAARERGGRAQSPHDRRPRLGQGPAQGAEGVDRSRRAAMRLLPVRHDHGGGGASQDEFEAERRRHRRCDHQHLPLRHLPAGARSDPRRRQGRVREPTMTAIAKFTRRSFLVSSAALGGGLALGLRLPPFGPAVVRAADGSPEITVWVAIRPDNTTLIRAVRAEMGQGTITGLAQLIAEELDCDWSKVEIEYPTPGESVARKRAWGDFSTGGSRGVRQSNEYVRKGGAAARMMLVQAAANEWKVPASECTASNSVITHKPSGRKTTYGKVAEAAARLEQPKDVPLKDPRSEEHTSELQSQSNLVCRLLLE